MTWIIAVETLYYVIVGLAIAIPVLSLVGGKHNNVHRGLAWIAVISAIIANSIMLYAASNPLEFFGGAVVHDKFTSFIALAASLAAAISLLASGRAPLEWPSSPAFYSLLPLVLLGVFVVSGAVDTFTVIASWLLLSVLAYVYVALPYDRESRAAAVRYILLGAIATLFLAVWVAFNSMVSTTENLSPFEVSVLTDTGLSGLVLMSVVAAIGFKTGVVPFHWWLPSVYGKAEGKVISVVASIIKLGFIALLARIVYLMAGGSIAGHNLLAVASPLAVNKAAAILAILAVATMTYGNVAALTTDRLKALLAYSSIAQIGYILAAIAALAYFAPGNGDLAKYAMAAIAVQAAAYGIAKSALFPLTDSVDKISSLRGLRSTSPRSSAATAILLLSLLGMPPMLGFWGKLFMFIAVAGYSAILVVAAFLNSAVSSGYYARFARDVLSGEPEGEPPSIHPSVEASLIVAAILILALGFVAPILFLLAL